MAGPSVTVQIDDRVRLLSVLLALTTWPEQEQDLRPHGVHAHARTVRAALQDAENHPAVMNMQELLESGRGLSAIFSYAGALTWPDLAVNDAPAWAPPDWARQIKDFMSVYAVGGLWEDDGQAWTDAEAAATRALTKTDPAGMLGEVFGAADKTFIFYPNLCYPSAEAVGFRMGGELACLCPPHVAWGESPPWPYDDDPPATHREAMGAYARVLLRELLDTYPDAAEAARKIKAPLPNTFVARYPDWFDQLAVLLVGGLTAVSLRETFSQGEADAFIMMASKAHGFKVLPSAVEGLDGYLAQRRAGALQNFAAYMPEFISGLKVV